MRQAIALTRSAPEGRLSPWLLAAPLLIAGLIASPARAQDEELTRSHGISTFGDLHYGPDFEHLDYVNPEAPQGGELSFAWSSGFFDSLHPYSRRGRPAVLSSIFFESMLESTADEIGSSYGLLAESLEYPEDRAYAIFNIRPEARFSDGTPVTADDALFSYEILRDEGLPSFRASLPLTIESAEVLDPQRIRYNFNPEAPLRVRIQTAGGLPVFSRASHEASGLEFEESRLEPLIGSGPYVLGEAVQGERVVYERNRDYWGNDLPINIGRHNFDSIRIEYYGDGVSAFEGFTGGSYTFRQESSSSNWANSYNFPALDEGLVVREEIPHGNISPGQSFAINLRQPQFEDPRVREAIALMFNFEWTNQTLFYGLYNPIYSFWENTDLAASGLPSEAELELLEPFRDQLREEVFSQEPFSTPPSNPDRAFDRRQARRALALLSEAGWEPGDDGMMRNAEGEVLSVDFLNSAPLFDRIINPYVENLRAIGIDASHNRIDNAQAEQRELEYDFDLVTHHFPMGYEPGTSLRQYFGSVSADNSVFNLPGLANPVVDELIEIVISAETREEMVTAVHALDRVLRSERIRVPQWTNSQYWVAYYDMYGRPDPLPPYALGFTDFWWIEPGAEARLRDAGAF